MEAVSGIVEKVGCKQADLSGSSCFIDVAGREVPGRKDRGFESVDYLVISTGRRFPGAIAKQSI